jgi:hypothetical protein
MRPYDSIMELGSLPDKIQQIGKHSYVVHGEIHQVSDAGRLFGRRHVQVARFGRWQRILTLAAFGYEGEPKRYMVHVESHNVPVFLWTPFA